MILVPGRAGKPPIEGIKAIIRIRFPRAMDAAHTTRAALDHAAPDAGDCAEISFRLKLPKRLFLHYAVKQRGIYHPVQPVCQTRQVR